MGNIDKEELYRSYLGMLLVLAMSVLTKRGEPSQQM